MVHNSFECSRLFRFLGHAAQVGLQVLLELFFGHHDEHAADAAIVDLVGLALVDLAKRHFGLLLLVGSQLELTVNLTALLHCGLELHGELLHLRLIYHLNFSL